MDAVADVVFQQSPEIVYGEGALSYLGEIQGQRAFLVTDWTTGELGFIERVKQEIEGAGKLISNRLQAQLGPFTSIRPKEKVN